MGWRDRDWAHFTDAERDAIYGSGTASGPGRGYAGPPVGSRRGIVRPGAGLAIAATIAVLALGQIPRGHPFLPALHIDPTGADHQLPLDLPPTATYGGILTINGTDPNATAGDVVAVGRWNGDPPATLASGPVSSDHSWSLPISMNQQGTLALTITLPDGDTLVGTLTVQPPAPASAAGQSLTD